MLDSFIEGRERHWRSLVKGVSWRAVGTLDTFVWSLLITGKPVSAGAIASLETLTKILLYYLHERIWEIVPWTPDGHLRSLVKAVIWRFVGSLDTFILSYLVTGKLKYAVSIAGIEALTKIFLFYLHERLWKTIRWGKIPAQAEAQTQTQAQASSAQLVAATAAPQAPPAG